MFINNPDKNIHSVKCPLSDKESLQIYETNMSTLSNKIYKFEL